MLLRPGFDTNPWRGISAAELTFFRDQTDMMSGVAITINHSGADSDSWLPPFLRRHNLWHLQSI